MSGLFVNTIATFILSVSLIVGLRRLAVAFQLVDRPDTVRKRHSGAIPLCGGIAVFSAFAIATFFGGRPDLLGLNFWLGLLIITFIGVVDDRLPLPAIGRLILQLSIAVALVGGTDIGSLSVGALLSEDTALFLPFFFLIGVLFVAGLVNSWNMLDGVDGLAGGVAAVSLIWLIVIAGSAEMTEFIASIETLLICLCAFLVFNMRSPWRMRASVFLGDAGSTALGATIAYVILLLATRSSAVSFPALLWVVIVPIVDTLSLIARRLLAHRSPMSADRWHLHHLLLDHGLGHAATTNTVILASAICGGIGYAGIRADVPGEIMAIGLIVPIVIHTMFVLAASGYRVKVQPDGNGAGLRSSRTDVLGGATSSMVFKGAAKPVLKDE